MTFKNLSLVPDPLNKILFVQFSRRLVHQLLRSLVSMPDGVQLLCGGGLSLVIFASSRRSSAHSGPTPAWRP